MKVSRLITRLVVIGFAVLALAAPVASARPEQRDATPADRVVIEPESASVAQSIDQGFDWDSAAIGAGGAGGLLLLVSLGGFTYRSRHHNHVGILR
ncbi:MAG: hypothetical protein QOE45_1978 [Frankiaceae bacterium]|jgi:hypothetical protein|nr:hypothetical protein [Frankiaceae bacterium]